MNHVSRLVLAAAVFAGCSAALAQTQPTTTAPALQGPSVTDSGVPGENRQFGDGKVKSKDKMGSEIPHRLFLKALDVLRADTADQAIKLTTEQDAKIRSINAAFMDSVSKFRQDHGPEIRDLIQQLDPKDRRRAAELIGREGRNVDLKTPKPNPKAKKAQPAPAAANDGDAMQPPDQQKSEDAKAKLRELFEAAPKPADTHAQIFAILTDAQKTAFQNELDRLRKDMQEHAGQKKLDRKAAAKDGSKIPDSAKDIDLNDPRIPERLRERLKSMTPEQRQQALDRLKQRLRDRAGQGGGEAKPAPSTKKDVDVPAPDNK